MLLIVHLFKIELIYNNLNVMNFYLNYQNVRISYTSLCCSFIEGWELLWFLVLHWNS